MEILKKKNFSFLFFSFFSFWKKQTVPTSNNARMGHMRVSFMTKIHGT